MNDKKKLKILEDAIQIGEAIFNNKRMRITCPFCYAMMLGIEIPKFCPHCGTKFEGDDNLNPETPREIDNADRERYSPFRPSKIKPKKIMI